MSISSRGPVNKSTHTFCNIDVTQTMGYWCSQKVVSYYENIIRNLGRVFKLFETQSDLFVDDLFVFLSNYSLEYNEGGSKFFGFFVSMCSASEFWNFAKHVHIKIFALNMTQIYEAELGSNILIFKTYITIYHT